RRDDVRDEEPDHQPCQPPHDAQTVRRALHIRPPIVDSNIIDAGRLGALRVTDYWQKYRVLGGKIDSGPWCCTRSTPMAGQVRAAFAAQQRGDHVTSAGSLAEEHLSDPRFQENRAAELEARAHQADVAVVQNPPPARRGIGSIPKV